MAITKADVIEHYITQRGVAGAPDGAKIVRTVDRILDKIWQLHQAQWHWPFMETTNVSVTISGVSGYFDYWATAVKMAVVTSLRNNSAIRSVFVPSEPIPKAVYDAMLDTETISYAPSADMSLFANEGGKIYPFPPGAAGSTLLLSGLLDAYQNTVVMPSGQEAALVKLIDFELGKSPTLDKYKQQCAMLGAKPIVDWWGVKYGI